MKTKQILLLLLLTTSYLQAQIVNIPDPNFKSRLLDHTWFGGVHIDTNNDDEIQVSEAEAITELIVGNGNFTTNPIYDMTGIEAFINITSLYCSFNEIGILDLSQNTVLEDLSCYKNQLTSLNVSQCSNLKILDCKINNLTSLSVTNNTLLETLLCKENSLLNIDLTQNTMLKLIGCSYNNISSLDVTHNTLLEGLGCSYNNISSLDATQNIQLKGLGCDNNNLASLNLTHNPLLETLGCSYNLLAYLNLSQNTNLNTIYCTNNLLTTLDLTQNTLLSRLVCHDNELTSIDLRNENNTILTYFKAHNNLNPNCILVEDTTYCIDNWVGSNFEFDLHTHFVETQEQCDAIGTEDIGYKDAYHITPNPIKNIFTIDTTENYSIVEIYNTLGQCIIKYSKQDFYQFNEPCGIYYVHVTTPKGIITKKIIKETKNK